MAGEQRTLDLVFDGYRIEGFATVDGVPQAAGFVILEGVGNVARSRSQTDAAGRFQFADVEPGDYLLHLLDMASGLHHQQELRIDGATRLDLEVTTGTVAGVLADAAERPLPGAVITLRRSPGSDEFAALESTTRTDSAGAFRILRVASGRYVLTASVGTGPVVRQEVEVTAGSVVRVDLHDVAGADAGAEGDPSR